MELLTKELAAKVPPLGSQENNSDPMVVAKFFTPDSSWTWYVIEGGTRHPDGCAFGVNCDHRDLREWKPGDDALFFGLVDGHERELGFFALSELSSARGPMGLKIERDLYWQEKPLSEVEGQ